MYYYIFGGKLTSTKDPNDLKDVNNYVAVSHDNMLTHIKNGNIAGIQNLNFPNKGTNENTYQATKNAILRSEVVTMLTLQSPHNSTLRKNKSTKVKIKRIKKCKCK